MTTDTGNTENQNEAAAQPSQCCDLLLRDHVEMVTKAILFEDWGNTRHWQDSIALGRAAITAYRPAVLMWRNDALEAAAKIAERYGQFDAASDIRALETPMTEETTENANDSAVSGSSQERLVMCDYCKHIGDVPAAHEFETETGARTFACEQHTNIALTCMKHIGPIST